MSFCEKSISKTSGLKGNSHQGKRARISYATQPQGQIEKGTPAQAVKTYTQQERQDYEKKAAVD